MDGGLEVIQFLLQIFLEFLLSLLGLLHERFSNLMYLERFIVELMVNFVELHLQHCDIFNLLHHLQFKIPQF